MDIENQFDSNVRQIVDELRCIVPVEFEQIQNGNQYSAIIKKDNDEQPIKAIVYYYEPLSQAKLYHELLHVKVGLLLGDNSVMLDVPVNQVYAKQLLCKQFCTDFLNQVEHYVFYSIYLEKGYVSGDFYEFVEPDSYKKELDELHNSGLKNAQGVYSINSIYKYYALLMLFALFPIDNRFKTEINTLKHIDRDLFQIMKDFKQELSNIKIESRNRLKFQELYTAFRDRIVNWISNHKIQ